MAKNGETARIKMLTDNGAKERLTPDQRLELIDALERLDAVMLPFAPHQRPFGTPGKWIDTILIKYELGTIPLVQHSSLGMVGATLDRICA